MTSFHSQNYTACSMVSDLLMQNNISNASKCFSTLTEVLYHYGTNVSKPNRKIEHNGVTTPGPTSTEVVVICLLDSIGLPNSICSIDEM